MNIGFLVRNTAALTETWTTTHWISAALGRGHRVWVFENRDLMVAEGRWTTRCFGFDRPSDPTEVVRALTRRTASRKRIRMDGLDLLLLRTAPLDASVLAAASSLEQLGVRVVNAPLGVLTVSHKSWLAAQDLPIPPTLVTSYKSEARHALETWGDVVVKPDRGSGGSLVARVHADEEELLEEAFDAARGRGGRVILQPLLDGSDGERRLLWCDGEILGGYVRRASTTDFRHNLKQGATPSPIELGAADRELGPRLLPLLRPLGIRFAGLDVLSERLVEVNAVNPGGTVYADALHGTRLADAVMQRLVTNPRPASPL